MLQRCTDLIILGSGVTGQSYLSYLLSPLNPCPQLKRCTVLDQNPDKAKEHLETFQQRLSEKNISLKIQTPDLEGLPSLTPQHGVLASPGWNLRGDNVKTLHRQAHEKSSLWATDMDLFLDKAKDLNVPLIGVTGTNGKSTVCDLLAHTLKTAGRKPGLGGNIGVGVLNFIENLSTYDAFVIEISSFQLEQLSKNHFTHGVFLNFAPDHLDYHQSLEAYFEAKAKILKGPKKAFLFAETSSLPAAVQGLYTTLCEDIKDSLILVETGTSSAENLQEIKHSQNAAFVRKIASDLGIPAEKVEEAFNNYHGLSHRQERISIESGILFVNDSKATNTHAGLEALSTFENCHWLVGGIFKEDPQDILLTDLQKNHIKTVHGYGRDGKRLVARLQDLLPQTNFTTSMTLEEAFLQATQHAQDGETVLLSPLCASYDQFSGFEARGEAFRELVKNQFKRST